MGGKGSCWSFFVSQGPPGMVFGLRHHPLLQGVQSNGWMNNLELGGGETAAQRGGGRGTLYSSAPGRHLLLISESQGDFTGWAGLGRGGRKGR